MKKFIKNTQRRSIDTKLQNILSVRMAKAGLIRSYNGEDIEEKSRSLTAIPISRYELNEYNVRDIYIRKCEELDIEMKDESCDNFTKKFLDAFRTKTVQLGSFNLGATGFVRAVSFFYTLDNIFIIDLSMNHIEDKGAIALADYLASDPQVIEIDLRSNLIGSKGSAALMKSLGSNCHLQRIDMSAIDGVNRNKIGIIGAQNLADSIGENQTLTHMNLSYYGFGAEECVHLGETMHKNESLRVLNLSDNKIATKGCAKLFKAAGCLGAIESLNISKNEIGDQGIFILSKQLMHNTTLRVLDLSHNVLTVKGLTKLLGAMQIDCHVEDLSIAYNKLNGTAKDVLTNFVRMIKKVKSFNIAGNPLKDECMIEFLHTVKDNDSYISLNISDTFITDKCVKSISNYIRASHNLQKFYMAGNSVTDKTGVPLAQALSENQRLQFISLRNCELKDRSAETFIEILQSKKRLPEMDLQYNNFSYKAFSHLKSVIEYSKLVEYTSVASIAQKTIEKLGDDEKVLNKMREELSNQRDENQMLKNEYDASADLFANLQVERAKSIEDAKNQLEDLKEEYQKILDDRRKAIDEYNDMRTEYESSERAMMRERQSVGQTLRAMENRLRFAEDKRMESTALVTEQITRLKIERHELLLKLQGLYEQAKEVQREEQMEKEQEKENIETTMKETAMKGIEKMIDESPRNPPKKSKLAKKDSSGSITKKPELQIPARVSSFKPDKSSSRVKVSKVTLRASTSMKPTKI